MFSIDQNCHSLWDVVGKLAALGRRGRKVAHYVEDIDAAFTSMGADVAGGGGAPGLALRRERFYRSGGADWGAALFYTGFLGRVPLEVRDWEPLTGLKTATLARQLGRDVDGLYDEFSPGDNWQLVGPSYVGDRRHHRLLGDLTVAETAPFIRELLDKAEADMRRAFPASQSRRRLGEWFAAERTRVEALLADRDGGTLVELYEAWLRAHVPPEVRIGRSSELFALRGGWNGRDELAELYLADYQRAAGLYNEALAESGAALRPLETGEGELPFFAALRREGHFVRTGLFLGAGGRTLRFGDREVPLASGGGLPVEALAAAGVECLAGKAAVMVCQVRTGEGGARLALPYRGSAYMPAAHLLAAKLAAVGLLRGGLRPVVRVRLRLLDRLRELDVPIRLPAHLAAAMGSEEVAARRLGESWADLMAEAKRRLASFRDEAGRAAWQRDRCADLLGEMASLDGRRREMARRDPKSPDLRELSHRARELERQVLDRTVRQIDRDWQTAELDYYDSRGAVLPWCVALGGRDFYNRVVAEAEIYDEPSLPADDDEQGPRHPSAL